MCPECSDPIPHVPRVPREHYTTSRLLTTVAGLSVVPILLTSDDLHAVIVRLPVFTDDVSEVFFSMRYFLDVSVNRCGGCHKGGGGLCNAQRGASL